MEQLKEKALKLGASDLGESNVKGKRLYVIYPIILRGKIIEKRINFGSDVGQTFFDHRDNKKRRAWRARHTQILRGGTPAYKQKDSPSYWAYHLLWN
jgi:hypothetical protein